VATHRPVDGGVEITIEQRQKDAWSFRIELAAEGATQRVTRRVNVTQRRQTFRLAINEPVVSVVVDARRDLPDPIVHERPAAMLLRQLRTEPEPSIRIGAMTALDSLCGQPAKPAECSAFKDALTSAAHDDAARVVRSVAAQTLERLNGATPTR
jgi:hypothetical protein